MMIALKKMKGAMSDRYVEHGSDINVEHAYTMVRVESFLFNDEEASMHFCMLLNSGTMTNALNIKWEYCSLNSLCYIMEV
jgi:hypothetical protein